MRIIYQIGRLDSQMKSLKFKWNEKEYEEELSSFVLKKHSDKETKVILIYPISLPFNRILIQDKSNLPTNLKEKIEKILNNEEEYFKDPKKFFEEHPHSKVADEFILIHSIGEYEKIKFEGNYNDIVLEIFFDMIKRYINKKFDELYIDISSGLNIYISALLEATRHFSVFEKLQNWNGELKIYKVFTDPIIGSSANSFKIYNEEMKFKVFFFSPIKSNDINNFELARKIVDDNEALKSKIQSYLENFVILFSAIKNSIPLALYTFKRNSENEIIELINEIIEYNTEKLKSNWKRSFYLPKNDLLNCLLALSFYLGIVRVLKKYRIEEKNEVDINEIKEKFGTKEKETIYKIFGLDLNIIFIGNEIRNLVEGRDEIGNRLIDKLTSEWTPLSEYISSKKGEDFNPRNFFTHAGFERTCTEVKKEKETIYLRYKENMKERIKNTLIEGV